MSAFYGKIMNKFKRTYIHRMAFSFLENLKQISRRSFKKCIRGCFFFRFYFYSHPPQGRWSDALVAHNPVSLAAKIIPVYSKLSSAYQHLSNCQFLVEVGLISVAREIREIATLFVILTSFVALVIICKYSIYPAL